MEERLQRQVLVHVDVEAPSRLHRQLATAAGGTRIDAARVGRELVGAVDVTDRAGRTSATATRSVNQAATRPSARSIASVRACRSARLAARSLALDPRVLALPISSARSSAASDDRWPLILAALAATASSAAHGLVQPTRDRSALPSASSAQRLRGRARPTGSRAGARSRSPPPSAGQAASCSGSAPGNSAASRRSSAAGASGANVDPLTATEDRREQPGARRRSRIRWA